MEQIHPLYDYIVVKIIEKEEKSAGGIILSDTEVKKNIQYCEVLEVGAGRRTADHTLAPLLVKKGDVIISAKYGGTDIGNDRVLLKEDHVFAIVEN